MTALVHAMCKLGALWLALLLFGFDEPHMGMGKEEGTREEIGHVWV